MDSFDHEDHSTRLHPSWIEKRDLDLDFCLKMRV